MENQISKAVDLLTQKTVRRICREFIASRNAGDLPDRRVLIVAHAVRDAQNDLEAHTTAAVPAQKLHSAILLGLVAAGLIRKSGAALVEVA